MRDKRYLPYPIAGGQASYKPEFSQHLQDLPFSICIMEEELDDEYTESQFDCCKNSF